MARRTPAAGRESCESHKIGAQPIEGLPRPVPPPAIARRSSATSCDLLAVPRTGFAGVGTIIPLDGGWTAPRRIYGFAIEHPEVCERGALRSQPGAVTFGRVGL
jgi:hypothetical protein